MKSEWILLIICVALILATTALLFLPKANLGKIWRDLKISVLETVGNNFILLCIVAILLLAIACFVARWLAIAFILGLR